VRSKPFLNEMLNLKRRADRLIFTGMDL